MEEAFREEEREQDRLHAVTNSGTCKRATSAGQQRRPMYTKHRISKPLSCPGKFPANACEMNEWMRYDPELMILGRSWKKWWILSYSQMLNAWAPVIHLVVTYCYSEYPSLALLMS